MITKDDWNAALDEWIATERERLGGPPTPAEIAAFVNGELPKADSERVQELLVYYPELRPLPAKPVRRAPAVLRYLPIAASIVIAMFFFLPRRTPNEPFVIDVKHELRATHVRGRDVPSPPYELPPDEPRSVLAAVLSDPPHDPAYRVEIVDLATGIPLWKSSRVQPNDDAIEVSIPHEFLHAGTYRLDVYGIDRDGLHLRDSYRLRATK